MSDVATIEVKPTPNVIERDAHSRRIDIEANVTEGHLATVVAAMEEGLKERGVARRASARKSSASSRNAKRQPPRC